MNNNDIMRALCEALQISDDEVVEVFALAGQSVTIKQAIDLRITSENGKPSRGSEARLGQFLDGLIIARRGPRDPSKPAVQPKHLSHNEVIKKLRIAWNLKELELLELLAAGGQVLSKQELGALFRKPGNKHYRTCSDEVLSGFIAGLAARIEAS